MYATRSTTIRCTLNDERTRSINKTSNVRKFLTNVSYCFLLLIFWTSMSNKNNLNVTCHNLHNHHIFSRVLERTKVPEVYNLKNMIHVNKIYNNNVETSIIKYDCVLLLPTMSQVR